MFKLKFYICYKKLINFEFHLYIKTLHKQLRLINFLPYISNYKVMLICNQLNFNSDK